MNIDPVIYRTSYKATKSWDKVYFHRRFGQQEILQIEAVCVLESVSREVDIQIFNTSGAKIPVADSIAVSHDKSISFISSPVILDLNSEIYVKASEDGAVIVRVSWREC